MTDTTRRTIIEGGMIKTIEEKVLAQAPLEAALAHIVTRQPAVVSNVPEGTKHIAVYPTPNGLEASLVVEEMPQVRHIVFSQSNNNNDRMPFRIHLPFVYFTFRLQNPDMEGKRPWAMNDWRVFMNDRPVISPDEPVLPIALPNTYEDGRTCTGNLDYFKSGSGSLGDIVRYVINTYWMSTFNRHLNIHFPGNIQDFESWQEEAAQDPMAWQGWEKTWKQKDKKGVRFTEIFGGKLKFDDSFIVEGMIPSVKMPLTHDRILEWMMMIPEDARKRITAEIIGNQQFSIKVPNA